MSPRLAAVVLAGCVSAPPEDDGLPLDTDAAPPVGADVARPDDGWLRGDLHVHTNFSDDAAEQGGDDLDGVLRIADAWRDPAWVAANPDLAPDDHLQFVAITDHRTVVALTDPAFAHPHLVLVGGEEFGSDGHAGIWGHEVHVPHEPQAGEPADVRIGDAIAEAHGQGALFSANHPAYAGDLWTWTVDGLDAVEVWNGPWSLASVETDESELDAWVAGRGGVENDAIRLAVRHRGAGQNGQAVRFWQALLSLGHHVAPVGGGDRHLVFPVGLPTTYVLAASRDEAGVLGGIADGATFVSRSPQGPQVVLDATVDGVPFPMGAQLPAGADEVVVSWRVGRAAGGTLTLWGAPLDPTMPDPVALAEIPVEADDASGTWTWTPPAQGGWLHAVVTDPLPEPSTPDLAALAEALLDPPAGAGALGFIGALGPLVTIDTLGSPEDCDPAAWTEARFQCMPADDVPLGTFYIPTTIQPWTAIVRADGTPTGDAMGAISAAFLVPAD